MSIPGPARVPPPGAIATVVPTDRVVRRILVACLVIEGLFVVLDTLFTLHGFSGLDSVDRLCNIAKEKSIPTFFGALQAVFVGFVVLAIRTVDRRTGASRGVRIGWTLIALFFIWLGIDDAAEIHEDVGSELGDWYEAQGHEVEGYAWQKFILPLYAAFGLFMAVFCWFRTRGVPVLRWFVAGSLLWVAAIGLDELEWYKTMEESWARDLGLKEYTVTHWLRVIEEMMEMVGTTVLGQAFLRYLAHRSAALHLKLSGPPRTR